MKARIKNGVVYASAFRLTNKTAHLKDLHSLCRLVLTSLRVVAKNGVVVRKLRISHDAQCPRMVKVTLNVQFLVGGLDGVQVVSVYTARVFRFSPRYALPLMNTSWPSTDLLPTE